jgi:murein DD-endopeptidase MepM/ murein hydrolase activator NlpD
MSLRMLIVPAAALGLMAVGGAHPAHPGPPPPGRLAWPLTGWVLTQGYGCTSFELEPPAPWCPGGHFHGGLDLAAPAGTGVHAAWSGLARVVESASGYGLHVVVDHGGGVETLYAHLEAVTVRDGAAVAAGQRLGLVGSTGMSTGPHLHFEVRRAGRPVDPTAWLPPAA